MTKKFIISLVSYILFLVLASFIAVFIAWEGRWVVEMQKFAWSDAVQRDAIRTCLSNPDGKREWIVNTVILTWRCRFGARH